MNDAAVYFVVVCISVFGGFISGYLYRIYCEEEERRKRKNKLVEAK